MRAIRPYIVRQGDYIARVAFQIGCTAAAIWDLVRHDDLRTSGRTAEILNPGDVLGVPNSPSVPQPFAIGTNNTYIVNVPKVAVHLTFRDSSGPCGNRCYVLDGPGWTSTGSTDDAGHAALAIPVDTLSVTLRFENETMCRIDVGSIDPVFEASGAIARLRQMGIVVSSDLDGNEVLREGLAAFQRAHRLQETGELDDATTKQLRNEFGC